MSSPESESASEEEEEARGAGSMQAWLGASVVPGATVAAGAAPRRCAALAAASPLGPATAPPPAFYRGRRVTDDVGIRHRAAL